MILESLDEIRAQGVTVHNCRTTTTALDVIRLTPPSWAKWTAMDADGEVWAYEDMPDAAKTMWRITFARQLVAANAINADMSINALCDAYHDESSGGVVDSIVAAIMTATDTQRVDLATALAQRAPHMADALATVLRDAVYDVTVDDDDRRCLLAAAQ